MLIFSQQEDGAHVKEHAQRKGERKSKSRSSSPKKEDGVCYGVPEGKVRNWQLLQTQA